MNVNPRPTLERIWITYLLCVLVIGLAVPGGGTPGHSVFWATCLHGSMLLLVLFVRWLAVSRCHEAARLPRALVALVGLPAVFSALCWLLPGVHPEPYEYQWLAWDRFVFGDDLARLADGWSTALGTEVLQIVYASFYVIVVVAAFGAARGAGRAAFDRAVLLLVGGFLCSYLGYLLFPTLAPKIVLAHTTEPQGLLLTSTLRGWIDAGEANPWDCFPSGHTMLTITSLIILWRWHRRWFGWLLLPGLLLIVSTMVLRYHWSIDVLVGVALAWPCVRVCDRLADRDGWPEAPPVTRA